MSKIATNNSSPKCSPASFVEIHKKFKESLEIAFQNEHLSCVKIDYDSFKNNNDADKKSALDQAFRELLLLQLNDISKVGSVISLSIEAVRQDIVSVTIPVVLLGDAFDAVTLEKCEQIFTFVEDRVSIWKEEIFFVNCKNNILRMCNDLLRRLSRTQNTVFCGRILLFLAKFFPFSERSGLNVISEFNLDNITEFGVDDKDSEEVLADTLEDIPVKIDYNLYCKFWALQDFFRNPNQCYNKVQWKVFASHATAVLSAFNSFKLDEQRGSSLKKRKHGLTNGEVPMEDNEEKNFKTEHFFAKFLTNPKLLALQLSDSNFRRSVLVQFLILFQYLTSTVKFKTESLTLNQVQSDFIKETEAKIYKLLEETPPQGKKFTVTVQHMLQREEIWNNWKNEGCKDFNKPDLKEETNEEEVSKPKKPKKSLGEAMKEASRKGQFFMGTNELTRLWNIAPDNLMACKSEDRNFLPQLETYLENPREKNDTSFEWRALRLLARQSTLFFTSVNSPSPTCKVVDYLESVRRKILKDKNEITKVQEAVNNTVLEQHEQESVALEEQDDAELMKTENLTPDDHNAHKTSTVTKENIEEIASKIGSEWKKLGKKLGFSPDELLYFESENSTVAAQAQAMLTIWFQDDEDATLDNLAYILEGFEMQAAAEICKSIIDPPTSKIEEVSD
ncbi:THO complex subunit 1 [Condylostylus longicornis]|uniref:THO complex subunit 1 n=1 Tax=Condylostylus longicornis TaxID=2530218 RepID=UPI00244DCE6D|nr:THO complex subunit 1 [Condylostylus longicornis]